MHPSYEFVRPTIRICVSTANLVLNTKSLEFCSILSTSYRLPKCLLNSIRDRPLGAKDDIVERDDHALTTLVAFEGSDGVAAALTGHHCLEVIGWVDVAAFRRTVEGNGPGIEQDICAKVAEVSCADERGAHQNESSDASEWSWTHVHVRMQSAF